MSILNSTRLRSVKRVRLLSRYHPDEEEAEAVFGAILDHEGIRQLNISQNQISRVNPDTLARALNFMEQVKKYVTKQDQGQDGLSRHSRPLVEQLLAKWDLDDLNQVLKECQLLRFTQARVLCRTINDGLDLCHRLSANLPINLYKGT